MGQIVKRYSLLVAENYVELSQHNSNSILYRFNYNSIKDFDNDNLNPFIVYILIGFMGGRKPYIYVGKSKNGILNRPTSHEDKCDSWQYCYVLTQTRGKSFFNDGIIQYLEDWLNKRVSSLDRFVNTTKQTTSGTVNKYDKQDCDDYLNEIVPMLFALGLDINIRKEEKTVTKKDKRELEEVESIARSLSNDNSVDLLKEYLDSPETDWNTFVKKRGMSGLDAKINEGACEFSREELNGVSFNFKPNNKGITASGYLTESGFVVRRKSIVADYKYDSKDKGVRKYGEIRKALEDCGTIKNGELKRNFCFRSPLEAAVVVYGNWCTQNAWVTPAGRGLGDLMKSQKKVEK